MEEQLIDKVNRWLAEYTQETASGCLLWTGALSHGYARVKYNGKAELLTRLICQSWYGPPFAGAHAAHSTKCVSRACVEPTHLRWATASDNALDAVETGTQNMTSKTHCAQGHPLSGENLILAAHQRRCRICTNAASRRAKRKKRETT